MFDKGPFSDFTIPKTNADTQWTSMRFSPDGTMLLLTTDSEEILLVDSYEHRILHRFNGKFIKLPLVLCYPLVTY